MQQARKPQDYLRFKENQIGENHLGDMADSSSHLIRRGMKTDTAKVEGINQTTGTVEVEEDEEEVVKAATTLIMDIHPTDMDTHLTHPINHKTVTMVTTSIAEITKTDRRLQSMHTMCSRSKTGVKTRNGF
ncbi:tRNA-dihydrouridine synthase B [Anopheles sinensis]|uniref:tRNA-dihydrouridine synthase B n=1 Tax=Anopheles sinensis TaxID=74873 RepID=A0A084VB03_ANOSI|nr:tRNA-dihydrouridine synthase B [Anopheles sinensis]